METSGSVIMHVHSDLPNKTNIKFTITIPSTVRHCTLLLSLQLHDRLDKERTMEGQTFRLSTALI